MHIQKLTKRQWFLHSQIRALLLEQGEACAEFAEGVAIKLAEIGTAAELEPRLKPSDLRKLLIFTAMPKLQSAITTDEWDYSSALDIANAIEAAQSLMLSIRPQIFRLIVVKER